MCRVLEITGGGAHLRPERLVAGTVTLDEAAVELARLDQRREPGMLVIDRF